MQIYLNVNIKKQTFRLLSDCMYHFLMSSNLNPSNVILLSRDSSNEH